MQLRDFDYEDNHYTYSDYITWDNEIRCELIDGVIYDMSPAPSSIHQRLLGRLFFQLTLFLKGKSCEAFLSPFDVRLNADGYDDTVVQPDILVVCDKSKIDKRGLIGAPDMVIEILSPYTKKKDLTKKYYAYMKYGVKEYWIIDPEIKVAEQNTFADGKFSGNSVYTEKDSPDVFVLDGFKFDLAEVFEGLEPENTESTEPDDKEANGNEVKGQ